ncbi:hypothetical protein ACFLZV_03760 [Candidatus Margulisiibacteriota bacterium]
MEKKTQYFLGVLLVLLCSIVCIESITGGNIFQSIFIRRIFFIPALLTQYYFEFFKAKPMLLSHSIFSRFVPSAYSLQPAKEIGFAYFNSPYMNANNGLISDGYMNFGVPGIILWGLFFALLLLIFKSLKANDKYFGVFVVIFLSLRNSELLTVIGTHGLGILFILFILIINHTQPEPAKVEAD